MFKGKLIMDVIVYKSKKNTTFHKTPSNGKRQKGTSMGRRRL
jgi:hypothetical protein